MERKQQHFSEECDVETLLKEIQEKRKKFKHPEGTDFKGQCIYVASGRMREANRKVYVPLTISIGPIHSGRSDTLKEMDKRKWEYFNAFLDKRTHRTEGYFLRKINKCKATILKYYGMSTQLDRNPFLKRNKILRIILLDSIFIFEHFLRFYEGGHWMTDDPILSSSTLKPDIFHDLRLMENQIPLQILEYLFRSAKVKVNVIFRELMVKYFEPDNMQSISWERVHAVHFTDLVRHFMLSESDRLGETETEIRSVTSLYSASELRDAGVKFKASRDNGVLEIKFSEGQLTLRPFVVQDSTERLWRNLLVFEQSHYSSAPYLAGYICMLNLLIKDPKDAELLIRHGIIVNLKGGAKTVVSILNRLSSHLNPEKTRTAYHSVSDEMKAFRENYLNRNKAELSNVHCKDLWKTLSVSGAIVVFGCQLLQTYCTAKQTWWP